MNLYALFHTVCQAHEVSSDELCGAVAVWMEGNEECDFSTFQKLAERVTFEDIHRVKHLYVYIDDRRWLEWAETKWLWGESPRPRWSKCMTTLLRDEGAPS